MSTTTERNYETSGYSQPVAEYHLNGRMIADLFRSNRGDWVVAPRHLPYALSKRFPNPTQARKDAEAHGLLCVRRKDYDNKD
jgi:hypothetical protein